MYNNGILKALKDENSSLHFIGELTLFIFDKKIEE